MSIFHIYPFSQFSNIIRTFINIPHSYNGYMTLNVRTLLSISTQLAFQSCRVIRQGIEEHTFKEYMKGQDDPVTDVDFKIQSMIVKGLKMHFPDIRIIGEESEEFKGDIEFPYSTLREDSLPQYSKINRMIPVKNACLWIDPIDCTRGFINGNYEDVTVLIGLSADRKPQAGIIATPYRKINGKPFFQPVVTLGSVQEKQTFDFDGKNWQTKFRPPGNRPLRVATSNTRRSNAQQSFLRSIKGEVVRAGGSGRKIMMVANGQADAMVYLESWTHKWDSCAGDAIIKAMGGKFTTPFGNNITYDPDAEVTFNKQGMVAALDREVYEKCMDAMAWF